MEGAKPRKPLYLLFVWEGDFENIVTDLTALPCEIFHWNQPLKLSNDAGDGEFPTSNRKKPESCALQFWPVRFRDWALKGHQLFVGNTM
jgi:hypothetical protein